MLVAALRGGTEYARSPVVRILRTEPNVEEDWPPNVEVRVTIAHPKKRLTPSVRMLELLNAVRLKLISSA